MMMFGTTLIILGFCVYILGAEDDLKPSPKQYIANFNDAINNTREPIIFFITPTHQERTQMVDLTRMGQFLQLSSKVYHHNIYWIVIEDKEDHCSPRIRRLLERSGLIFAHLFQASDKITATARFGFKSNKGINQRNHALNIIEKHYNEYPMDSRNVVVYFADSDNTYDTRLVDEVVHTTGLSVFPVGFAAGLLYERCLVHPESGLVTGFVGWKGGRKFPIDMAGFAIDLQLLLDKRPRFRQTVRMGRLESNFISMAVSNMRDLQPLASNCTKVYVWHTKTISRIADDLSDPNPGDAISEYERIREEV